MLLKVNLKKLRECWDNLAPEYDYKNSPKWFWANPEKWANEIKRRIRGFSTVLDVGCGAGALAIPLSKEFDVVALDFSKKMLFQLKQRKEEFGTDVEIVCADAHNIPFKDGSFDVVLCRFALWPLPEPRKAIEEMVRVARNRIIIVEGDWHKSKVTLRHKIIGRLLFKIHFLIYRIRTGRNPTKHFEEMKKYHKSETSMERIKEWFEQCGVKIREIDYSVKERVSTRRLKVLRFITGYEEKFFVLVCEKVLGEKGKKAGVAAGAQ